MGSVLRNGKLPGRGVEFHVEDSVHIMTREAFWGLIMYSVSFRAKGTEAISIEFGQVSTRLVITPRLAYRVDNTIVL